MKKAAVLLSLCVALGVALLPAAALADGRSHRHRGIHAHSRFHGGRGFSRPHRRHHGSRFPSTVFFYAPPVAYAPPVVYAPPPVVDSSPVIYSSPTVYSSQTVAYSQPATVAAAPPAVPPLPPLPPLPTVVEYATGRYELRGDGVAIPYVWVWIPNPPSAPPPQPAEAPPVGSAAPAGSSQIYAWTDETGTTFWTNRLDRVPEPYRSRAPRTGRPGGDPS